MTIREAIAFFAAVPRVTNRLKFLQEVGLGYLRLGQPASTLSGGEAQRVKLGLLPGETGQTEYTLYF